MAEEKKKRWRPSLGAYRAQESEITELRESLRLSEHECGMQKDTIKELRGKISTYENSNSMMEREISSVRHENGKLQDRIMFLEAEMKRLVGRGFFQRLFNVF